jgi:hypothetical protein
VDLDAWLAEHADDVPQWSSWRDRPAPALPVDVDQWLAEHGDEDIPAPPPRRPTGRQLRKQARAAQIAAGAPLTVEEWIRATSGERRTRTPVERRALFERDEWTCGLCGGRAEPWESASNLDLAAVLDHIIPLRPHDLDHPAGLDVDDNVQCAHRLCNLRKRNRVGWRAASPLGA